MFEQIVSKLSLSPSAAADLTFYSRRLKGERTTRGFSAVAAVMVVALQFLIISAPPTPTDAASPNDIIYGGLDSSHPRDDLLNHYDASAELKALYAHFGITRSDIVKTHVTTINSKDHTLKSIGRLQHLPSDDPVMVGKTTYWSRGLYTWDTGSNKQTGSTYKVLEGNRASDGGFFAVMYSCGNIVYRHLPPPPKPTPPPPPPTPTPSATPPPKKPTIACSELLGNDTISSTTGIAPLTVHYTGIGHATGQTIAEYEFNFGDGAVSNQAGPNANHTYTKVGKFTATLKVKGSTGDVSGTPLACTFTVTATTAPPAFTKQKTALNLTQNIDATTAPAHAGDRLRYILTTKNTGGTASPYMVVEHLEDVLQYADVTNAGGGTLANGVMTWPQTTIAAGASLTDTFEVTVKDPIPTTPIGTSDKYSYDLNMNNVYGNAINVAVQPPLPKQIETAAAQLPDTGPAASSAVVLIVAFIILFFYLRNRQLMSEIKLLRRDYQGGL